jgi:hypothetical protein
MWTWSAEWCLAQSVARCLQECRGALSLARSAAHIRLPLAESASVREQTIRSLAGHVNRQMFEHYSHIRSHAKQAAIRCPEELRTTSVSTELGHKTGHNHQATSKQ